MSTSLVPHIPEDAPFTPAQRSWLNGYLAGLYSYAPAQGLEDSPQNLRVALLYGSQTGTAEGLARKFSKELKAAGYTVSLSSLEGYVPATLAAETCALFIVSTYGEGEAPDLSQPFFEQLCVEHFPRYGTLSYAVFALGDSHYENFCQFGKNLDAKLDALGGTRILPRVDCDVEVAVPYARWKESVQSRLRALASGSNRSPTGIEAAGVEAGASSGEASSPEAQQHPPQKAAPTPKREDPYLACLSEKRALTHPTSSKLTIHLDFAISESSIRYEPGDACGVIPQNSPELVDRVLELLPFSGEESVDVPKIGSVPLREALLRNFAITRLTRKMVAEYATLARCTQLGHLVAPEQKAELESFLYGRDLIDLLRHCTGVLETADDLVKMLPPLAPRLYSIASSPAAHPGQIHTTVSVVRYCTHERNRGGVCSTLLADRIEVGDRLPLYIQPNKKFRLPQNPSTPIIMVGPGTGIAPFRSFLHERRVMGSIGRNWLFFGERRASTDFLYRDEIESMKADGHLTELDLAFSRDQAHKFYVQDLLMQNARRLWDWIEEGAVVYVCGDATHMAKDVDRTLHRIVEEQGGMARDAAQSYVQALKDDRRYQRDVY